MIFQQFQNYIKDQNLFSRKDKILLAISGGMDSVLMCHLFKEANLSASIAHCNFKLRGEDSDGDAVFVKQLAADLDFDFYEEYFNTTAYAEKEKISIQMAARDLRYEWLEKIRRENGFQYIATAHHLNDSIETIIYNFSKGCGIRGLHGILPKKEKIIRPLLFASRSEIEEHIKNNKIQYREDASNASDKYSRNFIRHQIIPKFKTLNASFEKSSKETIQKIRATEFLFEESISNYKKKLVKKKEGKIFIDYLNLPEEAAHTILFEILNPMGFNGDQIKMILDQDHQSGTSFYTTNHILLIDRDHYIVKKIEAPKLFSIDIEEAEDEIAINDKILVFESNNKIPSPIPKDKDIAILDFKKLTFPLKLRPWKAGDIFQPFGMSGKHQKIKEFLTNKRLTRFEKEEICVIESAGKICWVVGMRIDERFKVSKDTTSVFKITQKHKLV